MRKLFWISSVFISANPLIHTTMDNRTYINESHRKYSEECQKAVEEMTKHPLSHEQLREQMRRNREESLRRANGNEIQENG